MRLRQLVVALICLSSTQAGTLPDPRPTDTRLPITDNRPEGKRVGRSESVRRMGRTREVAWEHCVSVPAEHVA